MKVFNQADMAALSCSAFIDNTQPLVPLGIEPVDKAVGGLYPGACGILGIANGGGKSSMILASALDNSVRVGVVSTEDTPDVWGVRMLAHISGVDSLLIRKGDLTTAQRRAIAGAREALQGEFRFKTCFPLGSTITGVVEAVRALSEEGCSLVWLDYIQKVRGSNMDRRNEVAQTYTLFQGACAQYGVAGMAASQLRRVGVDDDGFQRKPRREDLKESGDLENEARLILLGEKDYRDPSILKLWIEKSTVGGEGLVFFYKRDKSGTLRYLSEKGNHGKEEPRQGQKTREGDSSPF